MNIKGPKACRAFLSHGRRVCQQIAIALIIMGVSKVNGGGGHLYACGFPSSFRYTSNLHQEAFEDTYFLEKLPLKLRNIKMFKKKKRQR